MLTPHEKKVVMDGLKECKNVAEMFTLLSNTFDLRACEPGAISKPVFIQAMMKGIDLLNPKLK